MGLSQQPWGLSMHPAGLPYVATLLALVCLSGCTVSSAGVQPGEQLKMLMTVTIYIAQTAQTVAFQRLWALQCRECLGSVLQAQRVQDQPVAQMHACFAVQS